MSEAEVENAFDMYVRKYGSNIMLETSTILISMLLLLIINYRIVPEEHLSSFELYPSL